MRQVTRVQSWLLTLLISLILKAEMRERSHGRIMTAPRPSAIARDLDALPTLEWPQPHIHFDLDVDLRRQPLTPEVRLPLLSLLLPMYNEANAVTRDLSKIFGLFPPAPSEILAID